jgi:hypothetical protein
MGRKDVNVVLVLEFLNQLQEAKPQNESLAAAFDLLAQMPEDFMTHRQDDLPQERDEWLLPYVVCSTPLFVFSL